MATDSEYKESAATGWAFVAIAFVLAISIACNVLLLDKLGAHRNNDPRPAAQDTQRVVVFDTFFVSVPIPRDSVVLRYEVVQLPAVRDTILVNAAANWADSMLVRLPIEQKEFSDDSTYRAYISGFDVALDSIFVYRSAVQQTIVKRQKDTRWAVGLTAGYGASKDGLSPYVGVGITYTLFDF